MPTNQNPGDVEISSLTISGVDYKDKLLSLSVTEYIFSPIISASVTVIQMEGDQSNFKFNQGDVASISFNTPSGQKRNYELAVDRVNNPQMGENQRTRKFTIECVSKHGITSAATVNYQKSLKNQTISDYVKTVATEGLKLSIPINVDTTRGLQGSDTQPIILTQQNPLAHIDSFVNMAVGSKSGDAFLNFSSVGASGGEEFNFKSLLTMIEGSASETITNKTRFELNSGLSSSAFNNIIDIKYPQQRSALDTADTLNKGHSIYRTDGTGEIVQSPNGIGVQRRTATKGLGSGTPGEGYTSSNGKGGSSMILGDIARQDTYRQSENPLASSIIADMKNGGVVVRIPGNSNIKVGDIINLDLRENTENFLNNDTTYYGKNIVSAITSFIGPTIDNPRYVSILSVTNIKPANGSIK